jgi:hypothetical protein
VLVLTRLGFLQQIQRLAVNGYYFYKIGVIPADKLPAAMKAFQEKYAVNPTSQQAWRAKLKGKASAHFLVYPNIDEYQSQDFMCVLMVSEGEHPAHISESLSDLRLRRQRLSVFAYELVQKPNPRAGLSFTFRLNSTVFNDLQSRLIQAVRRKNLTEVADVVREINYLTPFNGVKQQKRLLRELLVNEYEHRFSWEFPRDREDLQIKLNFTKAVKVESVKNIASFVDKMQRQQLSALEMLKIHKRNAKKRGLRRLKNDENGDDQNVG